MFSSSTRSAVVSAIVENPMMSPTTMTMSVTLISLMVFRSRTGPGAAAPGPAANRRDRNCSSAPPRRTRSPGLILTGMDRSIRCPLSRVPLVLWSVSQAWSSSRSSLSSRWVRETAGSSISSRCRSSTPTHSRPTTSQSYTGVDRSPARSAEDEGGGQGAGDAGGGLVGVGLTVHRRVR